MLAVGITGGIGSGKTTVCKVWEELGAFVLNADELAKKIMTEDEQVMADIKETFGEQAYHPDGTLNRPYLSEEAFQKGRVRELNAIVHPRIPEKSNQLKKQARNEGKPLFVYEAALLLENLRPGFLDKIVFVLADEDQRVKRVQQRDDVSKQDVLERMDKQLDFEQLTHRADYVIRNNGTLDELKAQAEDLFHELVGLG